MICEDEGITQMQLRRALVRAGMVVAGIASDGTEAVDVVLRETPDVVLMDIKMPGIDGIEAASRIMASYPVCIIMVTAYADPTHQQRARQAGSSGYIVKPITNQLLIAAITAALDDFRRRFE